MTHQSEVEELHEWLLLLLLLRHWSILIELDSANWASIVILEPVLNASFVEGVIAGELDAICAVLALLKTDVAVRFFSRVLLRKIVDELFGAATSRCWTSLTHIDEDWIHLAKVKATKHGVSWLSSLPHIMEHSTHLSIKHSHVIKNLIEVVSSVKHARELLMRARNLLAWHLLLLSLRLFLASHIAS